MSGKADKELAFVDVNARNGYYRDHNGAWLPDRRVNADRRADRIVELHIRGMRTSIRRAADREMWDFISAHDSQDAAGIRHIRPAG